MKRLQNALSAGLVAAGFLMSGAADVALAQGMGNMPGMNMQGTGNMPGMGNMPGIASSGDGEQNGARAQSSGGAAPMVSMPMGTMPSMGMPMMAMPMMAMPMMPMPMMGMGGNNRQTSPASDNIDAKIEALNQKLDALAERIEQMGSSAPVQRTVPIQ